MKRPIKPRNTALIASHLTHHQGFDSFEDAFADLMKAKLRAQQWKDIAAAMGIARRCRRTGKAAREWIRHRHAETMQGLTHFQRAA